MKKIKFLVLTFILVLALVACGQGANNNTEEGLEPPSGTAPETEEQEQVTKEAGETDVATKEPADPVAENEVLEAIYLYFSDKDLMEIYRVEEASQYTKDEEGIQRALQRWILGPEQEGLQSLVPEGVVVQSVEDRDGVAYISFSKELSVANLGSSGEAMLAEQIVMVVEQFGYSAVSILINGEVIGSLLGHVDWSQPFTANSPEDYELYNQ